MERGSVVDVDDGGWCDIIMLKGSGGGRALIHDGVYHLSGAKVNRKIFMVRETWNAHF